MANIEQCHQILIDQAHLLVDASETLGNFIKNTLEFYQELTQYFVSKSDEDKKDLREFERHSSKLKQYIDQVHNEIPTLSDMIQRSESALEECRREKTELQNELQFQKDETEEFKKKNEENLSSMNMQSTYSAALGSVFGTMLWKTSKTQEIIETFIDAGLLNQFLNIAKNTLTAFRETFKNELPMVETHEHKFIFSIYGIFINVVAQRIGRDFVLEREIGVEFVKDSIAYLGEITMPTGQLLKRLILMMLYNVTITKRGSLLIQLAENGVESILKCQDQNHSTEIQALSLTLMTTLIKELPTQEFCDKIINCVSQPNIQKLLASTDENVKFYCRKFIEKLQELGSGDTSMDD